MSNTQRLLSGASTERLTKANKQFNQVGMALFGTFPIILLLGIWVDWRFFPTGLVVAIVWFIVNATNDQFAKELMKRESADKEPG